MVKYFYRSMITCSCGRGYQIEAALFLYNQEIIIVYIELEVSVVVLSIGHVCVRVIPVDIFGGQCSPLVSELEIHR